MPSPDELEGQLELARKYAEREWRPFPVEYRGKRPAVVVGKWGTATASPAPDKMLIRWFTSGPVNVGIAAKGSGLVIIDEDREGAFERLASDYAQVIPDTYRVRTAKGWHYYFAAPEGYPIGNAPGVLADYGIDVRGGGDGDGGYVVAAGSIHESGHVYTAHDNDADAVDLPWWLTELLLQRPVYTDRPDREPVRSDDDLGLFGDDDRRFTRAEALIHIQTYGVGPLADAQPGHRNRMLNQAAILVGHFTGTLETSLLAPGVARDRLRQLGQAVGLDVAEVHATVRSGLKAGMADPYVIVPDPVGQEEAPDAFERDVASELRKLQVRDEAQRRHRLAMRAERPSILSGIIDDLDSIEPPSFLMDGLIPDNAVGFLAGRSGSYKSFLAIAFAFAIATGTEWSNIKAAKPLKVLYVAAEGYAGAVARIKAWEQRTGQSRRGQLLVYPRPIALNDADQAAELAEAVKSEEIQFLVVDTYHRSAPGTEENDATAFGLVFNAVARLRDDMGVGVLFVDHTGKVGTDPRGSSAKGDDADYVLVANYEGVERGQGIVRTLTVRKLKDEESGAHWVLQLQQPTSDNDMAVGFPVVVIPEDGEVPDLQTPDAENWREKAPAFPEGELEALRDTSTQGRGVRMAQGIWRLMAWLDEGEGNRVGLTTTKIRQLINDGGDPAPSGDGSWSEESIRKAVALLVQAKLAVRKNDRIWLAEKD